MFNDVQQKLEAAMKARAETVTLSDRGGAEVHAGVAADDLALPRIIVLAEEGTEIVLDTGQFEFDCWAVVLSSARVEGGDALALHRARVSHVFDAFMQDDLAALLSAAGADFHCLGVHERTMTPTNKEEDRWESGLRFKAVCGATDL